MRRQKKNESGITLVALVITIIILLILAGIAIVTLTQTGLFENAKQAKNAMENAQNTENVTLAEYSDAIEEVVDGSTRNQNGSSKVIWTGNLKPTEKLDLDMSKYDYIELYILSNHHTKVLKFDLTQPVENKLLDGYDYVTSIVTANSIQDNEYIYYDFCEFAVNKEKNNLNFYNQGYTSINVSNNSGSSNKKWETNTHVYRIIGGNYNL